MAAFTESFSYSPAGAPPVKPTSGSISDLYPKALVIQRIAAAKSFAVLSVNMQTAVARGRLSTRLQSPVTDKDGLSVADLPRPVEIVATDGLALRSALEIAS